MKLLICTQKVDRNDPILGFFHRWIEEFAKHCEKVTVICLFEGEHALPKNVSVHSLGKERGASRLVYLSRFFSLIWQKRNEYDTVFVHMNPEYIVLGGLLWRTFGKKVGLWYTHKSVDLKLRIAEKLVHSIFTASKESFRLTSQKLTITGHAIDMAMYKINIREKDYGRIEILTTGRISAVKKVDVMVETAQILKEWDVSARLTLVGEGVTTEERIFENKLRAQVKQNQLKDEVVFTGALPHRVIPEYLFNTDIFLNLSETGSMDKAVLEAMAAGVPVVSSNEAFRAVLEDSQLFFERPVIPERLAKKLIQVTDREDYTRIRKKYREYIKEHHSLPSTIYNVVYILQ